MWPLTLTIKLGRSGGSFVTAALRSSFPERAITDEPLGPASTLPRAFFHAYDEPRKRMLATHPPVVKFMDQLAAELERGPVVATGPTLSHLAPVIAERFPDQLRVLGLFRHPLFSATEHFLRGRYHGWPAWSIADLACLTPFDPGMLAKGFRERWKTMSPFEKNLYRWVEYVLLWREVQRRYPHVPTLHVSTENLFQDPQTWLQRIADFAGLHGTVRLGSAPSKDFNLNGRMRYPLGNLWRAYRRHPEVLELAAIMGYRLDDRELEGEMRWYQPPHSAAYQLLFAARWYHVKGYVGYRLRPRYWRDRRTARRAERLLARCVAS
jgi:hypothetical protein